MRVALTSKGTKQDQKLQILRPLAEHRMELKALGIGFLPATGLALTLLLAENAEPMLIVGGCIGAVAFSLLAHMFNAPELRSRLEAAPSATASHPRESSTMTGVRCVLVGGAPTLAVIALVAAFPELAAVALGIFGGIAIAMLRGAQSLAEDESELGTRLLHEAFGRSGKRDEGSAGFMREN